MKKLFITLYLTIGILTSTTNGLNQAPIYLHEIVIYPKDYGEIIKSTLIKCGVEEFLADIIVAQARHESADFTSKVFEITNNPFGMRLAYKRPTTRSGQWRNYSYYDSVELATIDYFLYMTWMGIPVNGDINIKKYVTLLKKKSYFEAEFTLYYMAVKKHYENNQPS